MLQKSLKSEKSLNDPGGFWTVMGVAMEAQRDQQTELPPQIGADRSDRSHHKQATRVLFPGASFILLLSILAASFLGCNGEFGSGVNALLFPGPEIFMSG